MKREILDIRWSNVHTIGADVKAAVRTEVKGTEKIRTKSGIGRERKTKECIENIERRRVGSRFPATLPTRRRRWCSTSSLLLLLCQGGDRAVGGVRSGLHPWPRLPNLRGVR